MFEKVFSSVKTRMKKNVKIFYFFNPQSTDYENVTFRTDMG